MNWDHCALLVKPAAARSRKGKALVNDLESRGAYLVTSASSLSIADELTSLNEQGRTISTLVAIGGDGTVHLALNSIVSSDISLAVIPMGTGNDLARAIGIKSVADGIRVLDQGEPVQSDIGLIECADGTRRYYIGITSVGFDAQVNARANTYRGPSGTMKYLAAVFRELAGLSAHNLAVTYQTDLGVRDASGLHTLIAIGNTNSYGGGMFMCPAASLHDGALDITAVSQAARRTLVRVLPTVFFGRHVNHPLVRTDRTTSISISQVRDGSEELSLVIYADGEFVGHGDVTISVKPSAVSLWQVGSGSTA